MGKDVIIALDFDSRERTLAFLDQFTQEKPFVKIGMELYYAEGPAIVREIKARGHKIFLDLKPGVTVTNSCPQASWTFPASRGEQTTPASPAWAARRA